MKRISWRTVASILADRMELHAYCYAHEEAAAEPETCPFCADRAAYRLWQIKRDANTEVTSA